MFELKNLNMLYENQILKDINFSSRQEEINVIIGPSGCGKTSLLNISAGNIKKFTGSATFAGKPISPKNMSIGLVAQDYGLLPWKTVYDNIVLPLKIKKLKLADYRERISHIMDSLQITDLKKRYPSQLSGGQKQRAALAKVFILDLDLLLMDEPFSALDAITRERTQQLFLDIWSNKKPITLFVTHSIDEAVFLGKKIIILSALPGTIVKIIENPLFDMVDKRNSPVFHEISVNIRQYLKLD